MVSCRRRSRIMAARCRPQPARIAAQSLSWASMIRGGAAAVVAAGGLAGLGYYLVVSGKLTIDTGWGRRGRPLGPFGVQIAAPASTCST